MILPAIPVDRVIGAVIADAACRHDVAAQVVEQQRLSIDLNREHGGIESDRGIAQHDHAHSVGRHRNPGTGRDGAEFERARPLHRASQFTAVGT
jgi:hypothetical protein